LVVSRLRARPGSPSLDLPIKLFSRKKQAGRNADDEHAPHPFGYDLLIAWIWMIRAPVKGDTENGQGGPLPIAK
jgi:hypothetical protein